MRQIIKLRDLIDKLTIRISLLFQKMENFQIKRLNVYWSISKYEQI